ncbi:hypothetical protein Leryth_005288 [Lithospermum erythrorhizon]|nr:hypothetical protein Leryth_005288 [Lithospermum erythrorhizon]
METPLHCYYSYFLQQSLLMNILSKTSTLPSINTIVTSTIREVTRQIIWHQVLFSPFAICNHHNLPKILIKSLNQRKPSTELAVLRLIPKLVLANLALSFDLILQTNPCVFLIFCEFFLYVLVCNVYAYVLECSWLSFLIFRCQ